MLCPVEHVAFFALRNDGRVKLGAAGHDVETVPASGNGRGDLARRQRHTPRVAIATHVDFVAHLAFLEHERNRVPAAVRPPRIEGAPR